MRIEALTVVSISVFWLVAQCNDIDRLQDSEENAVSMFKAGEFDLENGGIIFFRGAGTQKNHRICFPKKTLRCEGKCVEMLSVEIAENLDKPYLW